MMTYKQLGYVYRSLREHEKATNNFKKYLQLAWYNGDMDAEMQAYENLSLDYFYLGSIQKAIFYDTKFKYGEFEGKDSVVRKVAVGIILHQIDKMEKDHTKEKLINGKSVKTIFDRMPSPSSFGGGI